MCLSKILAERVDLTMRHYRADPDLIREHARQEQELLSGGYGARQIFELVQNGADAIGESGIRGRVEILLTKECLYCANEGSAINEDGVRALLMAHLSGKRRNEIGRFGLGFKSVLGVCESPEFYSHLISFRFNPPNLARQIRDVVGADESIPRLRTAEILKVKEAEDHHLAQMLSWATTVIRLALRPCSYSRISKDLKDFPPEFLVFSPQVHSLVLSVPDEGLHRELTCNPSGERVSVSEGDLPQVWRVFSKRIPTASLSDAARMHMDARLREREEIPLIWAVPDAAGERQRGRFWAFFPTQTETTLQGILNAPWQTNSDRENLLDGDFNAELIAEAASLVAEGLQSLGSEDDPARFLDCLPARDDSGWADRMLAKRLWELLTEMLCLPTVGGVPCKPRDARLRPDVSAAENVSKWQASFGYLEPFDLVHRSVQAGDRPSRAKRLGTKQLRVNEWLKEVAGKTTPESSIGAIRLVDALLGEDGLEAWTVRSLAQEPVVLTREGTLVCPDKSRLAFADEDAAVDESHSIVHDDVAACAEARSILEERFSIGFATRECAFRSYAARSAESNFDWNRFWNLSRHLDSGLARDIVRSGSSCRRVKARTLTGDFLLLSAVLLPGPIVDESAGVKMRSVVIDMAYHSEDEALLRDLGASECPREGSDLGSRLLVRFGCDFAEPRFRQECGTRNPQSNCLYIDAEPAVEPLDPIERLEGEAAARMSQAILSYAKRRPGCVMRHKNPGYPSVPMISPLVWVLREFGWMPTSVGPMPLRECVGPQLAGLSDFLPVVFCSEEEETLMNLPSEAGFVSEELWLKGIARSLAFYGEESILAEFYAVVAGVIGSAPTQLRCRGGAGWCCQPPGNIFVSGDHADAELLRVRGEAVIHARTRSDAETLVRQWGMRPAPHERIGFEPSRDAQNATDAFPGLRQIVGFPEKFMLQPCASLWVELRETDAGQSRHEVEHACRNDYLYFAGDRDSSWLLRTISDSVQVPLTEEQLAGLAAEATEQLHRQRLVRIRDCGSIEEKLLAAIGPDHLRSGIPQRHLSWLEIQGQESAQALAQLALSVYGVEVLKAYRDALSSNGLKPPSHWTGKDEAVSFVRDLGFPEEYAGFPVRGREPWEDVLGPVELPRLHDFQARMLEELRRFLDESPAGRGVLSLPTGAGKTRVVVQSIVEWIRDRGGTGTLLWIAQSDELCEQSVESWMQAWRAFGPENMRLRVGRMWGATNDKVRKPDKGSSLVVATFQTLQRRLDRSDMDWVFEPDAVVIDEAHGGISSSYTRILGRLGLDQRNTARPLIGLTATPFRGDKDERETWRLAFRFDHRRFDMAFAEAPDLYLRLQDKGVLAYAEHAEPLRGGQLELTEDELRQLKTFMQLPASAESRLGADEARNERILGHLLGLPGDWPVLLFAASVEHAEDMAVRLNMRGVPACAISSETSAGRRRHAIESFKSGRLRVLTNYGVLTTGFDAPAIRAVYVTRPVYSPLLYQQMIGRGLRGPLNGGKERCLVVNVEDNIAQYGEDLAFHKFEYLWGPSRKKD